MAVCEARRVGRKRLYLMPDYGSTGLWWEPGGMVDPSSIPLSDETKAALDAWIGQMHRSLDAEEGIGPPLDEGFGAAFADERERLATVIRAELPAEYDVGIARFDTGEKRIEWLPAGGA